MGVVTTKTTPVAIPFLQHFSLLDLQWWDSTASSWLHKNPFSGQIYRLLPLLPAGTLLRQNIFEGTQSSVSALASRVAGLCACARPSASTCLTRPSCSATGWASDVWGTLTPFLRGQTLSAGFSRETWIRSSMTWACLHIPAALGSVDVAHLTSAEPWEGATDALQDTRSLQVF